jgi:hypothetical protein
MHATLLTPGGIPEGSNGEFVYARSPLGPRLLALRLARVSTIYGEFDWMFWRNAADVAAQAAASEGAAAGGVPPQIDVLRVAQATHQQMIDNPLGFADAVFAAADAATAGVLTVGAGIGRGHGAEARVWQRPQPLPQDNDPITQWTEAPRARLDLEVHVHVGS